MTKDQFEQQVFVNCPFDKDYAPLLEAILFCIVRSGLIPRLASEALEGGESRLAKILDLIECCRYSVHDLSLSRSTEAKEIFRMNMPFELGLDLGRRWAPDEKTASKKTLIFEKNPYDLKAALSDLAGVDVQFHRNDFQTVIKKLRDFLRVEAKCELPGASKLEGEYYTFLAWMTEKKIYEGHNEKEATELPTQERLDEMFAWNKLGRPDNFEA